MTPEAEGYVNGIFVELQELFYIADELDVIGKHYGMGNMIHGPDYKDERYRSEVIGKKTCQILECMTSIQYNLIKLVREIRASEDGQAS